MLADIADDGERSKSSDVNPSSKPMGVTGGVERPLGRKVGNIVLLCPFTT